ncbi:MAG: hypothetical protein KDN19_23420 [Verrucomicrobiae bacterium]|nr:hypothetical protein [Verrucomicrobiae bacterium]
MKLKSLATALAGVFAASVAYAGTDAGKEVCVMEEPLGATLSAGYMTNYVFYGVDLGEHGIWTSVDYTIDAMGIPVDVGVWYINPADGFANDELDVYASVTQEFAGFDVTTGVVGYFFPESGADATYELALGLGRSLGVVDWNGTARYDFELQAWYFDTGISKEFALCDSTSLVISTGIGYQIDYWAAGNAFNDVYVKAALPIALRSNVTLEPYVAGLFALDAIDGFQDDIIHGGVSLSVDF